MLLNVSNLADKFKMIGKLKNDRVLKVVFVVQPGFPLIREQSSVFIIFLEFSTNMIYLLELKLSTTNSNGSLSTTPTKLWESMG